MYDLNTEEPNEDSPIKPFNDYGQSKYKSEILFEKWANTNDKNTLVVVRPTVIFGEKNRGKVYNLLNQIVSEKFIMVGKGKNKKSMGYVINIKNFLKESLKFNPGKFVYN